MSKLITWMIMLSFCLPLNAQPTPTPIAQKSSKNISSGKQELSIINEALLNSSYHDYCPINFNGGLLFTSDRVESGSSKNADANFYFSMINSDGSYSKPVLYDSKLNSTFQDGMATISPDGKTMIFSRDIKKVKQANGFSDVRLYSAKWINGSWAKVKKMGINAKDFSSGHPTISADGKELYFISNRPGGFGGTDIYVSILKNGKWGKPKNLGPKVNSPRNELFPFVDASGQIYFSSNRRAGMGLLDIYSSTMKENGKWTKSKNIGEPFNSPQNDFGYYSQDEGKSGFFSSNRPGGKGGNDIYYWGAKKESAPKTMVSSVIKFTEAETKRMVSSAKVSIVDSNGMTKEWTTDINGQIEVSLEKDFTGILTVTHPAYKQTQFNINEENRNNLAIILVKLECIPMTGQLTNDRGEAIAMNDVSVYVSNMTSKVEQKVVTNRNGVFEICLDCNYDYSVKTISDQFYLDETEVSTKDIDCNNQNGISKKIQLIKVAQDDGVKENPNMNTFADETPKPISEREREKLELAARNKSKLESISIAEPESNVTTTEIVEAVPKIEEKPLVVEKEEPKVRKRIENVFMVPNIYFDFDSYNVESSDYKHLNDLGAYLKDNPTKKVAIKSFADPIGSEAYNKWLSKRRAEEVVNLLMKSGVVQNQIEVNAIGENTVVEDFDKVDKKEIYSKSRRAEFSIIENENSFEESGSKTIDESAKSGALYISSINYGFDAYTLNMNAIVEVDKLIVELQSNPNLKVEIRSHTDSRGSSTYNQKLSQKRANEVARFIQSKGIASERLTAKGFGESDLINDCKDGVPCTKSQHKENRRTEFVFEK